MSAPSAGRLGDDWRHSPNEQERALAKQLSAAREGVVRLEAAIAQLDRLAMQPRPAEIPPAGCAVDGVVAVRGGPEAAAAPAVAEPAADGGGVDLSAAPAIWFDLREFVDLHAAVAAASMAGGAATVWVPAGVYVIDRVPSITGERQFDLRPFDCRPCAAHPSPEPSKSPITDSDLPLTLSCRAHPRRRAGPERAALPG